MPNTKRLVVTLNASGTTDTFDIEDYKIMTILIGDNLTSTILKFNILDDNDDVYVLTDEDGNDISVTIAANPTNDAVGIDASLLEIIAARKMQLAFDQAETATTVVILLKK